MPSALVHDSFSCECDACVWYRVRRLIKELRSGREQQADEILDRMFAIPPSAVREQVIDRIAFSGHREGGPIPLSSTATIPTKRVAELLADLCELKPDSKVLEIGTGSGYQSAVLAERCAEVVTIEINPIPGVADRLPANVTQINSVDGARFSTGEQFDAVLVTFAAPKIAEVWAEQVKEGGVLVIPEGDDFCCISVYRKRAGKLAPAMVAAYGKFTPQVTQ